MKCNCGKRLWFGWKCRNIEVSSDYREYVKKCKCGITWLNRAETRPGGQLADYVKLNDKK